MSQWSQKRVVITGASEGIGAELALQLATQGARIVLASRRLEALELVAGRCRTAGGEVWAVACDVTDDKACEALIKRAVEVMGGLDVLVNNAGIMMVTRFEDTPADVFRTVMNVNYFGAVACTRAALPALRESKGLLVAVSSINGKTGIPTRTGYAASKHAMQGFFDSLRIELRGSGVDVLVFSPGMVQTGIRLRALGSNVREEKPHGMTAEACARRLVRAMERRERDVLIPTMYAFGQWVKLLAPRLIDSMAERGVR